MGRLSTMAGPPGTARSNVSMHSNMSQGRLEKLMRLQHRENSKPRVLTQRSRSQTGNRNPYNQRPVTGQSQMGYLPPPTRPATGMSLRDQNDAQQWERPPTGMIDEEYEYEPEEDIGSPPQTAASGAVVDEWALLNELDITSYQLEQERRRQEEAEQKAKVRMDLMNQMREKSKSQQLARANAEQEWREQKDRLDDWNEKERTRADKRVRRMERRRQMLMKQMEMSIDRKKMEKKRGLDEGRQIAAQIREDMHEERERTKEERVQAMEEFRLQCEENELLQKLKHKQEEAEASKAVADLDRYFSKKEQEEMQRQQEIADRYNSCRLREKAHANKCKTMDANNTRHRKTDEELEQEMLE